MATFITTIKFTQQGIKAIDETTKRAAAVKAAAMRVAKVSLANGTVQPFSATANIRSVDLVSPDEGWAIAQTTLGYERGGRALARVTTYASQYRQLVDAARRLKRNGRPIVDDPVTRQKLGRVWADLEVERYGALRTLTMLERGEHPGAGGSISPSGAVAVRAMVSPESSVAPLPTDAT